MAYTWPTPADLRKIEAVKVDNLLEGNPLASILPMRDENTHFLEWEVEDNNYGLQQVRGLNGPPARVNKTGSQKFIEEPGVYGEYYHFNELEMTELARVVGTVNEVETVDGMIAKATSNLADRFARRWNYIGWTLLMTGAYSVTGPNGQVLHSGAYSITVDPAPTSWTLANRAAATPLADFGAQIANGPAVGTNFGRGATAYMNDATFRLMMLNTNANDLGGRRLQGLQPVNNPNGLNEILTGDGLPNIVIYDGWYLNDAGDVTYFIPTGYVLLVGARPGGQGLGQYSMTRNANNNGRPGPYNFVNDTRGKAVPPSIEVHSGHNGGPVIWYPGSIRVMDVR